MAGWSAGTLLFGTVSIQSAVVLENAILFCKLSRFSLGDSFEVSPEVIVQRFFHFDLDHSINIGFRESGERADLSLSTNSDSLCFF